MTWLQRIRAARKRGYFIKKDNVDAENWASCAVSENKKIKHYENDPSAAPISDKADKLGMDFYNAVKADAYTLAEVLLRRIKKL